MKYIYVVLFFLIAGCVTTDPAAIPDSANLPPVTDTQTATDDNNVIVIKKIEQWVSMCERQPDSPACVCLADPDLDECK